MNSKIPYSYHLYHVPTQTHYYGVRHGRGCHPDELWKTYFSSSKPIKDLIESYGPESFRVSVRKTFSCAEDALCWEHTVLRRLDAAGREDWANRHNGGTKFCGPVTHSEKTRKILSRKLRGRTLSKEHREKISEASLKDRQVRRDSGWRMSEESRKNISDGVKKAAAKIYTPERNAKMSASKKGTKRKYLPDGSYIMIREESH